MKDYVIPLKRTRALYKQQKRTQIAKLRAAPAGVPQSITWDGTVHPYIRGAIATSVQVFEVLMALPGL